MRTRHMLNANSQRANDKAGWLMREGADGVTETSEVEKMQSNKLKGKNLRRKAARKRKRTVSKTNIARGEEREREREKGG
jgi:hypothetical protein